MVTPKSPLATVTPMTPRWPLATVAGLGTVAAIGAGCSDQEPGAFAPAGTSARELSVLFWVMVGLGGAVFLLVMVTLTLAARGSGGVVADEAGGHGPLQRRRDRRTTRLVVGGGIVLPVAVLVPLSIAMLVVGDRLAPRLGDAYEIEVTGHQFWWEVRYPDEDVVTANEIHIPTDTRVRVLLRTEDVIHSFWVPQLAGKIDMIPGQTTEVLIDADEPGRYVGICAEFCGVQHARMRFLVVAQSPDDFDRWLDEQAADARQPATETATSGQQVFAEVGCGACHRVRGTDAAGDAGPDLTHFASRSTIGALTLPNERGYLAGWIADPQAVKPGNLMPPTPLSSEQLLALLEYVEGLE